MTTSDSFFSNSSLDDPNDCLLFSSDNFSSELDEEMVEIDLMMDARDASSPSDDDFGSYTAYVNSFRAITPPPFQAPSKENDPRTISRSGEPNDLCILYDADFADR